jgi:hypothetical protein
MKYAVEMGSGAMIYKPSFVKIGSGTQKFMGGGEGGRHIQKHRQHGDLISLLSLFQNKESRLNIPLSLSHSQVFHADMMSKQISFPVTFIRFGGSHWGLDPSVQRA